MRRALAGVTLLTLVGLLVATSIGRGRVPGLGASVEVSAEATGDAAAPLPGAVSRRAARERAPDAGLGFEKPGVPAAPSAPADPVAATAPVTGAPEHGVVITIRVVDQYAVPVAGTRVKVVPPDHFVGLEGGVSDSEGLVQFVAQGDPRREREKFDTGPPGGRIRFVADVPDVYGSLALNTVLYHKPGAGRDLAPMPHQWPVDEGHRLKKFRELDDGFRRDWAKKEIAKDEYASLVLDIRPLRRLRVVDVKGVSVGAIAVQVHYKRGVEPPWEDVVLDADGEADVHVPVDVSRLWVDTEAPGANLFDGRVNSIPARGPIVVTMLGTVEIRVRIEWPDTVPQGVRTESHHWYLVDRQGEFLGFAEGVPRGDGIQVIRLPSCPLRMSADGSIYKLVHDWDPSHGAEVTLHPDVPAPGHAVRIRVLDPEGNPVPLRHSFIALNTTDESGQFGFATLKEQPESGEAIVYLAEGKLSEVRLSSGGMWPGQPYTYSTVLRDVSVPTTEVWEFTFPAPREGK